MVALLPFLQQILLVFMRVYKLAPSSVTLGYVCAVSVG